jgi:hypothetical protein
MSLGGVRGFPVRLDCEFPLQVRGPTVREAGPDDDRMTFELGG